MRTKAVSLVLAKVLTLMMMLPDADRSVRSGAVQFVCPRLCQCVWKKGKETVDCRNAGLRFIPMMTESSGTQLLNFSGNPVTVLEEDVFFRTNMLNLQEIILSRCSLIQLHRHAFRSLWNLVRLDLSHNELPEVPWEALWVVGHRLHELNLSQNPITSLSSGSFAHLTNLQHLDLSGCGLSILKPTAFVGLTALQKLRLDENELQTLKVTLLQPLASLRELRLEQNPWVCDCHLKPLILWIESHNLPLTIPPACHQPANLSTTPWTKLFKWTDSLVCQPQVVQIRPLSDALGRPVLQCIVHSSPPATISWTVNGDLRPALWDSTNGTQTAAAFHQLPPDTNWQWSVVSRPKNPWDVVECVAWNHLGKASARFSSSEGSSATLSPQPFWLKNDEGSEAGLDSLMSLQPSSGQNVLPRLLLLLLPIVAGCRRGKEQL